MLRTVTVGGAMRITVFAFTPAQPNPRWLRIRRMTPEMQQTAERS